MLDKYVVKKVINEWDPIGLFPVCPEDEYSTEIEEITLLANSGSKSIEELGNIIFNVFDKYFDSSFTKCLDECLDIAKQIISLSNIDVDNE